MRIVMSSGHGKYIRGASGYIDEVDEARLVVEEAARIMRTLGPEVTTFHDDISHSQNENLNRIVDFHNDEDRDLDISVHFNAYETTSKPMGCEVLYVTQEDLADKVVAQICAASGLIDRGPKKRTDLFFLNNTEEPAILIEVCFVDSKADTTIYHSNFDAICGAIASSIVGTPVPIPPPDGEGELRVVGTCSTFGGPEDTGVSPSEGLAFYDDVMQKPELFLPYQPSGTTGLARRLNPHVNYIACRWDYEVTPREMLRSNRAIVRALRTGISLKAFPADWGPHKDTGRVADLSPGLMEDLGITTDDEVQVVFPYLEEA
jgi:hypothetical protein